MTDHYDQSGGDARYKAKQLDLAFKRELIAEGAAREEPLPEGVVDDFEESVQFRVYQDLLDCTSPHYNPPAAQGIKERAEWGKAKYGTYLKAFNGRFGINDARSEAADLVVYLKQCALEGDQFAELLYPQALFIYTSLFGRSTRG